MYILQNFGTNEQGSRESKDPYKDNWIKRKLIPSIKKGTDH